MKLLGVLIFLALAILALRGLRWAYAGLVGLILLYFPASTGFRLHPSPCDLALDVPLAVQSLSNYRHIILFAFFFVATRKQLRLSGWRRLLWSIGLTIAMGAMMELAQALSGNGHCRTRDLIPDGVGAMLGLMIVLLSGMIKQRRAQ
jgi:hypothetical protein